jgi:von Willebrand factor type A C-terminal domain/von Willebrand factor type A domain
VSAFMAEVYQNEFLPAGSDQVHAVVTVSSTGGQDSPRGLAGGMGTPPRGAAPDFAEVILLDCSGSMANPPEKISQARRATKAAIGCLRDGVWFAVVRGTGAAGMIYPEQAALVAASPSTRAEAMRAVDGIEARGGTAIGRWLGRARQLMLTRPDAIHHAILLTDGQNGELAPDFVTAVDACRGRFQCDCRGVGTDWRVDELRAVATALLGSVDAVRKPADLVADFTRLIETATGRATDRVALRIWTPPGARVRFLREVAPTLRELTDEARPVTERTADYPTGAWGVESRDYHLNVEIPPRPVGTEVLAARVGLVVDNRVASTALVRAVWTADDALAAQVSPEVAHYTGQAELARALQEGLEARQAGDMATATLKLGRSAQLALASGNEATYRLLQKVVEIDDPTTGTVRLKKNVDKIDEMVLDTRSTRTVRVNR